MTCSTEQPSKGVVQRAAGLAAAAAARGASSRPSAWAPIPPISGSLSSIGAQAAHSARARFERAWWRRHGDPGAHRVHRGCAGSRQHRQQRRQGPHQQRPAVQRRSPRCHPRCPPKAASHPQHAIRPPGDAIAAAGRRKGPAASQRRRCSVIVDHSRQVRIPVAQGAAQCSSWGDLGTAAPVAAGGSEPHAGVPPCLTSGHCHCAWRRLHRGGLQQTALSLLVLARPQRRPRRLPLLAAAALVLPLQLQH